MEQDPLARVQEQAREWVNVEEVREVVEKAGVKARAKAWVGA